jgi:hypothetical protein
LLTSLALSQIGIWKLLYFGTKLSPKIPSKILLGEVYQKCAGTGRKGDTNFWLIALVLIGYITYACFGGYKKPDLWETDVSMVGHFI